MPATYRLTLIALICGSAIMSLSMGVRQGFGLFLPEAVAAQIMSRELFSFVLGTQTLVFGLVSPVAGYYSERFGARPIVIIGAVLFAAGLIATSLTDSVWLIILMLGVSSGIGLGATTFVVIFGALARIAPPQRRDRMIGTASTAASFGMFVFIPITQILIDYVGWRGAMLLLGLLSASIALLAYGLRGDLAGNNATSDEPDSRTALRLCARHHGYIMLNCGFFVCGFHVSFIAVHLPSFLRDQGLSQGVITLAFSLLGFCNIIGSYFAGRLGEHFRKKYLLTLIYLARAVVIIPFLILPVTPVLAVLFCFTIGLLWLSTVPLTSGLVVQMFGSRSLATLYGIVFVNHQLGGFIGAWGGGYVYDRFGSYDLMWILSIMLALLAAGLHWPIKDYPAWVRRAEPTPA